MEGLEQRLDGASWKTGRLRGSPIGREPSNFPPAGARHHFSGKTENFSYPFVELASEGSPLAAKSSRRELQTTSAKRRVAWLRRLARRALLFYSEIFS